MKWDLALLKGLLPYFGVELQTALSRIYFNVEYEAPVVCLDSS